jgi:hypothetical protein
VILATSTTREGKQLLVLGLQQENIDRLLNDEPIWKDLDKEDIPGLEGWAVTILGPEDTVRFMAAAGIELVSDDGEAE